jgi:hypothetical protein
MHDGTNKSKSTVCNFSCYNIGMAKKRPIKTPAKPKSKPGPAAELFKIEGIGWEDAVKKSLQKKKPAGGWPK